MKKIWIFLQLVEMTAPAIQSVVPERAGIPFLTLLETFLHCRFRPVVGVSKASDFYSELAVCQVKNMSLSI